MSKLNFSQAFTEINNNGFVVHRLSQMVVSTNANGAPNYSYECEVCNEEGINLTERGDMALEALVKAIAAIHAVMLGRAPIDDDCEDLV